MLVGCSLYTRPNKHGRRQIRWERIAQKFYTPPKTFSSTLDTYMLRYVGEHVHNVGGCIPMYGYSSMQRSVHIVCSRAWKESGWANLVWCINVWFSEWVLRCNSSRINLLNFFQNVDLTDLANFKLVYIPCYMLVSGVWAWLYCLADCPSFNNFHTQMSISHCNVSPISVFPNPNFCTSCTPRTGPWSPLERVRIWHLRIIYHPLKLHKHMTFSTLRLLGFDCQCRVSLSTNQRPSE